MKRFLTVDWDYCIDCSADFRVDTFPNSSLEYSSQTAKLNVWKGCYTDNPSIKDIGTFNFETLKELLSLFIHTEKVRVEESHEGAYYFILYNTKPDEVFEVVNIDFHHDLYNFFSSRPVNCSNWVTRLFEARPNMNYVWVKRDDSEEKALGVDNVIDSYFPNAMTCPFNTWYEIYYLPFLQEYVGLFLCRSDIWSPPHLDSKFNELVRVVDPSKILPEREVFSNE